MAFRTEYRLLCRVKIRHGYYLDAAGKSFFDEPAAEQAVRLERRAYDVRSDLRIEPTDECRRLLNGNRLLWRSTADGLLIGIELEPGSNKSRLPLPPGLRLAFTISLVNGAFANFTNYRLEALDLPFRYYFSNTTAVEATLPSLSGPVMTFAQLKEHLGANRRIEMGEYVRRTNAAAVSRALVSSETVGNSDLWVPRGATAFVHTGDRWALPKRFALNKPVRNATAVLKSADGAQTIARLTKASPAPEWPAFDFTALRKDDVPLLVPDGAYQLTLEGDLTWNNPAARSATAPTVYLFDALVDSQVWGVIELVHDLTLPPALRLQETDRSLPEAVPEFEIRLAARPTYWHYPVRNAVELATAKPYPLAAVGYQIEENDKKYRSPGHTAIVRDAEARRYVSVIHPA
jgi:hypothetical protein